MKLFAVCDGRLGNQLFIAAYLDAHFPHEPVLTAGFEEMREGFVWARPWRNIRRAGAAKKFLNYLARRASTLRLISHLRQIKKYFPTSEGLFKVVSDELLVTNGLFPIVLIDRSPMQQAIHAASATFELKPKKKIAAQAFLASLPEGPKAFVHCRRGDYRDWTIFGKSPLLPMDYYQRGIEVIRRQFPDTQFILVSDTPEDAIPELPGVHHFAGADVYEDFALMTLCDGGVMSCSTLSWWGGYMSAKKLPLIAPENWVGWTVGIEYHRNIMADWMTPIAASEK